MKIFFTLAQCLLLSILISISGFTQSTTYLYCGTVLDCTNSNPKSEQTIIVKNNRIASVRSGYIEAPDTVKTVDLKDHSVMPGLMDMHVHIEGQSSPTTVRDLGGTGVNVSLRNAITRGFIEGPRIYTCEKGIGTTGGHADQSCPPAL